MKKLLLKILGWPNYLRRLQWLSIHKVLDLKGGETVLDLGAGPMQYSIKIAKEKNVTILAADINLRKDRVSDARKYGVIPLLANGYLLPFKDKSIDCILMSSLLHMVPEPNRLLNECKRVLRNNGYVVLTVPNYYQFIPGFLNTYPGKGFVRLFDLPKTMNDLIEHLNLRFQVGGPQGYYSLNELTSLLKSAGFEVVEHEYSPGWFGSLLWELAVLCYVRFGNIAFHLLFFTYPLVRFLNLGKKPSMGSEHLVRVLPVND